MGDYSSFYFEITDAKVNAEKIKKIEEYFSNPLNEGVYGFQDVKIEINNENKLIDITFKDGEYYRKFYDAELFAKMLSEALTEGRILLKFQNCDDIWGYRITPEKIEELNMFFLTNKELTNFKKFKAYLNVLAELSEKEDDKVIVETLNGSGACDLKLPKGTSAGEIKNMLKFLFNDLAHDLEIHKNTSDFDSIFRTA